MTGTNLMNVFVGLFFCKADPAQNKIDFMKSTLKELSKTY